MMRLKVNIPKKKRKEEKKIVVDEYQMVLNAAIAEQQKMYTKYLIESIASEIDRKIHYLGLAGCAGCNVGRLSQRDHDVCLMMTSPEKFELYYDQAIKLLTFENVRRVRYERLQKEIQYPISKAEFDAYEIADNPLKRFNAIKGSPEEIEKLKDYVKSVYPYFN